MLALFDAASTKDPRFFSGFQILCGSQSATALQAYVNLTKIYIDHKNTARNGPSGSSKVVDFGTNRKCVCDFLFVMNSNLGPIRDIAGFLLRTTSALFHPKFRGVPLGLDYQCCHCCGSYRSEDVNFELVQPICPRYINVTERHTY